MSHIKQLDSIRGIAVLLVLIHHSPLGEMVGYIPLGPMGVNTFFVLSGFLITKILLDNRNHSQELDTNRLIVFKNFFFRRALRIFPIYYLTLFLLLIFYSGTDTNKFLYFFTYTSNFYFYKIQSWDGIFSHLWTLAVEEQFYLLWPWVMLFINKKYLLHTIVFFIIIGIVFQYFIGQSEFDSILTPACFDSLGCGALLAWIIIYKSTFLGTFYKFLRIAALITFVVFLFEIYTGYWSLLPLRTAISILSLFLITYIVYNTQKKEGKQFSILNNKFLIFIGTISYGIYLYHRILIDLTTKAFNIYINNYLPMNKILFSSLLIIVNLILIILLSWFSWKFIEKPILGLKRFFVN